MPNSNVSSQQLDAVRQVQGASMVPGVVQATGAGKGYQSVAQSAAIAVQDGTDYLRNLRLITTTAIGVATAQMVATNNPDYASVITEAQAAVASGTKQLGKIGKSAAKLLKDYPS